jgi:hypothetical protein
MRDLNCSDRFILAAHETSHLSQKTRFRPADV